MRYVPLADGCNSFELGTQKSRIYTHVLTPLNQSQWNIVEKQVKASGSSHVSPAMDCEVDDVCLGGMAQASIADDAIMLDACREVRAKLYLGQVLHHLHSCIKFDAKTHLDVHGLDMAYSSIPHATTTYEYS